jgi:hypothetical protein
MRPVRRHREIIVGTGLALASLVGCRAAPATEPASEQTPAEAPSVCDEHAQRGDVPTRPPPPDRLVGDPTGPFGAVHDAEIRVFSEDASPR